jgi:tRNA-uridine 2-sulfurtransferase
MNPANSTKTVVVGMSGGVDSSVSAALLKEAGYKVIGLFMKNWDDSKTVESDCSTESDFKDVERVCRKLDIPNFTVELVEEYWNRVFTRFLKDYESGLTPNPDILCNREIKFDAFYDRAMEYGADFIATGHYCQTDALRQKLLKGLDPNKDQTYFLYAIDGKKLDCVLFPVGGVEKPEVRKIAQSLELSTHDKKDSTGICFIGEKKFRPFLAQYLKPKPGPFKTLKGEKVGTHSGVQFYTLGQRKGLGLGGEGERWFVVAKDPASNTIIVERGEYHPALYTDELWADELTFIHDFKSRYQAGEREVLAKTRYRQSDQPCTVTLRDSAGNELSGDSLDSLELEKITAHLRFKTPQRAVTPGQALVLYSGSECLGGGTIRRTGEDYFRKGADVESMKQILLRAGDPTPSRD